MSNFAIHLSFTMISCEGCGIKRIRGVPCADCERRPEAWEVDSATLARRKGAVEAQQMLTQAADQCGHIELGAPELLHAEVCAALHTWMTGFFDAVAAAAASEEGAQRLKDSVTELVGLRAALHRADDRRPVRQLISALRGLIAELESMVGAYLETLLASTPLLAQNHGARAQRHLDAATEAIARAQSVSDAVEILTHQRDASRAQARLLQLALSSAQQPSLLALDSWGRDSLREITGSRGTAGHGVFFGICRVIAQNLFNDGKFCDVLRRAYQLFSSNPEVLETLAASTAFEEDFRRAALELFDGSMEAAHVMDHAVHSRQAGRALLGIAAALVEGPGQVMATALLLACGRKTAPFETLRHKNATEMISSAQTDPRLQGLLAGLDNDLRTGRAHALVHYHDDHAVIERKTASRTVTWGDVIDGVFHGYECVMACQIALIQALAEHGFTDFGYDGLWQQVGISAEEMTRIVLEGLNFHNVDIATAEPGWRIEAHGGPEVPLQTVTAMLQPYVPLNLEHLMLTAHQHDRTHVVEGPLAPWRDTKGKQDDDAQALAWLRVQLTWTYDGAPWLPAPTLRRWVAIQGAQTLEGSPAQGIRRLRGLRDVARLGGDDALVWALSGAIRYVRLGSQAGASAELKQLQEWCELPIELPSWWESATSYL
ncbi:hypothetical protein [Streptomyces sp. NPDC055134]